MPGKHNKPMMGHKPKMVKKGLKALADKNPELEYVGPKMVDDIRPKMAMPKVLDNKNFPKMAQDMADVLVQKMDGAKMYKPTKYHDGPKMAHGDKPKMYGKPKMMAGDGKHTGKVVTIGGKKYDTRSSEYKALTSKKQAGKAQGANYIGGSKDGKPVTR